MTFLCTAYFFYNDRFPLDAPTYDDAASIICWDEGDAEPVPAPIHLLPCHDSCEDGTYANVEVEASEIFFCHF